MLPGRLTGAQAPQMEPVAGEYSVEPIFTVGDRLPSSQGAGYFPPGILDGLGAYDLDALTVRVLANHELRSNLGYDYSLANGASLSGARVSFFDIEKRTREVVNSGVAYNAIVYTNGQQIDDSNTDLLGDGGGLTRFCSAQFIAGGTFNFEDSIYFAGEEDSTANGGAGGLEYALDVDSQVLYAVPEMGHAAWENVTPLESGNADKVALLIGDDRTAASLYLYLGNKGLDSEGNLANDFLSRNGLANGTVYAWKADSGDIDPARFNGTGSSRSGTWVALTDLSSIAAKDADARAQGAFQFARPEDVATDPNDATRGVFATAGRSHSFGGADSWGTTYLIDVEFSSAGDPISGSIVILYDGDDAGGGQFAHPDFGLRNSDNLDWAEDGFIYVQEDESVDEFGTVSGEEASIWKLDPNTSQATRIARMDRSSVPEGQEDFAGSQIGTWESSGILDVSALFDKSPGSLLLFDVQANTVREGTVDSEELVRGGQLVFLHRGFIAETEVNTTTPGTLVLSMIEPTELTSGQGSLAVINFTVRSDAPLGDTVLDLRDETNTSGSSGGLPITINDGLVTVVDRAITGAKFNDINGDGVRDPGEPGLEGFTIELDSDGDGVPDETTTTNASGHYFFASLAAGDYTLRQRAHGGFIPTTDVRSVTLEEGTAVSGQDFGSFRFGAIHGHKYEDLNRNGIDDNEPRLSNVTIHLDADGDGQPNETAITDANGRYSFGVLGPGTYIVTELVPVGQVRTSALPKAISLQSGAVHVSFSGEAQLAHQQTEVVDRNLAWGNYIRPRVSIQASDPFGTEEGSDSATFTIKRDPVRSTPLIVNLAIGGTATNFEDYSEIELSVQIPANVAEATITVTPKDDEESEGTETVELSLVADLEYLIEPASPAMISIEDNDVPPDIEAVSFTTGASASQLVLNYDLSRSLPGPFEVGFFASSDTIFSANDKEFRPRISVDSGDDLAFGPHTLVIDQGEIGQMLARLNVRFVLAVIDPNNAVGEVDETNNTQNYVGFFHQAGIGTVIRGFHHAGASHGSPDDKVLIDSQSTSTIFSVNEQNFTIVTSEISRIVILTEGGSDIIQATDQVRTPLAVKSGAGVDFILGGRGADLIIGQGDGDLIAGGPGPDRLQGGKGNDQIDGNSGDDIINGGKDDDKIQGATGNDRALGSSGNDEIWGGDGNDSLNGHLGRDKLFGNDGDDRLLGGEHSDSLDGGKGNDVVLGMTHLKRIDGAVDLLFGGSGIDRVIGPIDVLDELLSVEKDRRRPSS